MGLCIHYRSSQPMHPALAFEVSQHAAELTDLYAWISCEPVVLSQRTNGLLYGNSKPDFSVDQAELELATRQGIADGNLMTVVEVLCELSRCHPVDWELSHDYEPDLIGRITSGTADAELMDQLETLESIGDLLEDYPDDEDDPAYELEVSRFGSTEDSSSTPEDDRDDEGPRLLRFPGAW